jgi:hypothetical protein
MQINFNQNQLRQSAQLIVVADFFVEEVLGGAELTTNAILSVCPYSFVKIKSSFLTADFILANKDKYWLFGNFFNINFNLVPLIINYLNYSVIEYDYKFCKYRSTDIHAKLENKACDCSNKIFALVIQQLFLGARQVWWMSEEQLKLQLNNLKFLNKANNLVLGSVFSKETLDIIKNLTKKSIKKSGVIVFNSDNWLKGTNESIEWCKANNLNYCLAKTNNYLDMLMLLRKNKMLVYLPNGKDTCPRLVIEAKLLGCQLVLNDNVQHKNESWFNQSPNKILKTLESKPIWFWSIMENYWSITN